MIKFKQILRDQREGVAHLMVIIIGAAIIAGGRSFSTDVNKSDAAGDYDCRSGLNKLWSRDCRYTK